MLKLNKLGKKQLKNLFSLKYLTALIITIFSFNNALAAEEKNAPTGYTPDIYIWNSNYEGYIKYSQTQAYYPLDKDKGYGGFYYQDNEGKIIYYPLTSQIQIEQYEDYFNLKGLKKYGQQKKQVEAKKPKKSYIYPIYFD